MRACVRLTREIFAQPAFDRYRGREIQPGERVQSDAEIDAFVRAKVESAYHPSCTCRMGDPADPTRGSRQRDAGHRTRGAAGGRLFHHAVDHHRQSQRADHHAGGEGRRPHSRPRAAAARRRAVLRWPPTGSARSGHDRAAATSELRARAAARAGGAELSAAAPRGVCGHLRRLCRVLPGARQSGARHSRHPQGASRLHQGRPRQRADGTDHRLRVVEIPHGLGVRPQQPEVLPAARAVAVEPHHGELRPDTARSTPRCS